MSDEKYGRSALYVMYRQGKGILSPARFSEKKTQYEWIGFGIGSLGFTLALMLAGVNLDGWREYLALVGAVVIGVAGVFIASSIFEANFVCDDTLQDPLFLYRQ